MKKHKLQLTVEVSCPEHKLDPELTMTLDEVCEALHRANYAVVCPSTSPRSGDKLTSDMLVKTIVVKP